MSRSKIIPLLAVGLLLGTAYTGAALAQKVLKSDPPAGTLQTGTSVLVDDGSCGPGKIKKLTRVGPMSDREGGFRKSDCIPYRKK